MTGNFFHYNYRNILFLQWVHSKKKEKKINKNLAKRIIFCNFINLFPPFTPAAFLYYVEKVRCAVEIALLFFT